MPVEQRRPVESEVVLALVFNALRFERLELPFHLREARLQNELEPRVQLCELFPLRHQAEVGSVRCNQPPQHREEQRVNVTKVRFQTICRGPCRCAT